MMCVNIQNQVHADLRVRLRKLANIFKMAGNLSNLKKHNILAINIY